MSTTDSKCEPYVFTRAQPRLIGSHMAKKLVKKTSSDAADGPSPQLQRWFKVTAEQAEDLEQAALREAEADIERQEQERRDNE